MDGPKIKPLEIAVLVAPHFNVSATTSFLDPFRVTNYLSGISRFSWTFVSDTGGPVASSAGLVVETQALDTIRARAPWLALVSTSWTPERHVSPHLKATLQKWHSRGTLIGGIDTGAILLAHSGLLRGQSATVHYEHIDAFAEIAPETTVTETMFVIGERIFTCCGGTAATDIALRLLHSVTGESMTNAAARYIFHHEIRDAEQSQKPDGIEPLGYVTPSRVRAAVDLMERNLETPLSIPDIAARLGLSQRQLSRLFQDYVKKSPVEYYRDIRLDRARGLVTQTELKLGEIAVASGFNSQVHFSRAYRQRFGLPPSADRIAGRVPFEYRAWPMYKADIKSEATEPPPAAR